LFFVSDAGDDFRQLVYLDLTTEKAMTLLFGNEEIARRIAETPLKYLHSPLRPFDLYQCPLEKKSC